MPATTSTVLSQDADMLFSEIRQLVWEKWTPQSVGRMPLLMLRVVMVALVATGHICVDHVFDTKKMSESFVFWMKFKHIFWSTGWLFGT